jgi:hypothetical protein
VDAATTPARPAVDSGRDRQSGRTSPIQRLSSTVADPSAPAYSAAVMIFDHDVIDRAPAARLVSRLRELVESGYGLHTGEGEQLVIAR